MISRSVYYLLQNFVDSHVMRKTVVPYIVNLYFTTFITIQVFNKAVPPLLINSSSLLFYLIRGIKKLHHHYASIKQRAHYCYHVTVIKMLLFPQNLVQQKQICHGFNVIFIKQLTAVDLMLCITFFNQSNMTLCCQLT